QKENIVTLLTTFFDAIGTFVEHIQWFSDWLDAHPQVKEVFANLLKLAAVALPFILAMGLLTKTFGKLNKIFSAALGPVARGIQGTSRVVRQTGSGIREGLRGDGFGDARDRQSRAYRNRRTQLRGGDVRGPIARLRDGITGRDSGADRLRQQMRQTEDSIRETEDAIRSLQREIRDTNAVSIRQLVDRFAGSSGGGGGGSLQGAARNANQAITNTTSETRQLNQQSLNSVRREYSDLENKVKDLVQKIKDSVRETKDLNDLKLTSFKMTVDSAENSVNDLEDKLKNTAVSVGELNRRKLGMLQGEFDKSTSDAEKFREKVEAARKRVSA